MDERSGVNGAPPRPAPRLGDPRGAPHNARMFWSVLRSRHVVVVLAVALASCAGRGPVPGIGGMQTADESRANLVAVVTVAPLARIATTVDALGRKLPLPFAGEDLARMLAASLGLGADAPAQLDPGRAFGAAFVSGKQGHTIGALAVSGRDERAAEAITAGLGRPAETRGAARRIDRPDGKSVWVMRQESTIVSSDSHEGLVAAGALAIEAQRAPLQGEVTAVVFPPALARAQGKTMAEVVAGLRRDLARDIQKARLQKGLPPVAPGELLAAEASLQFWLEPLADTDVATVVVDLDPEAGVSASARLQPRPGTPLAAAASAARPFIIHPGLTAGGDLVLFTASTGTFALDFYEKLFALQAAAGFDGAGAVTRDLKNLRRLFSGTTSFALRSGRGGATYDALLELTPGTAPDAALDALVRAASSPAAAQVLAQMYGARAPKLAVVRDGPVAARLSVAFPTADADDPADLGRVVQSLFGTRRLDLVVTGSPGQVTVSTEPGARVRVGNLAQSGTPPPELAAALAETKGAAGVAFVDAMGFARPVLAAMPPGAGETQALKLLLAFPGIANLKLPAFISHRGGNTLAVNVRVPLVTLTNLGGLLRPFMGAGRR